MASYKSDATALLAEHIDKENNVTTPAGVELEVKEEDVAEVSEDVAVETVSISEDSTE